VLVDLLGADAVPGGFPTGECPADHWELAEQR